MKKENFMTKFYLDKEKDIIVNLYKTDKDEMINNGKEQLLKTIRRKKRRKISLF